MTDKADQTASLEAMHTPEAIEERIAAAGQHNYLGDFVLGAVDGTVTTFAIVAGVAGAGLSSGVAVVLGVANVAADGFSMASSSFLKARADRKIVERFRRMEEMHIDEVPEGERDEIRQIFAGKGFDGELLEEVVRVITDDRKRWVDTMLTEEWGLQLDAPAPLTSAATTFVAFILAGFVPLLPLFAAVWLHAAHLFPASAALTAATFLLIGYIRGKVAHENALLSAIETLIIGGIAAAIAYFTGTWLQEIAGRP